MPVPRVVIVVPGVTPDPESVCPAASAPLVTAVTVRTVVAIVPVTVAETRNRSTVTSADVVTLVLAMVTAWILTTCEAPTVTTAVGTVVMAWTAVFPVRPTSVTMLGAGMSFYPPVSELSAIARPAEIPPDEVTVTAPVLADTVMPDPATRLVTPVAVTVTAPVADDTAIPVPATMLFTPAGLVDPVYVGTYVYPTSVMVMIAHHLI